MREKVCMNSSHPSHALNTCQLASVRKPDSVSTLSLCSMNSAKFSSVWVTSAMSWEVRANSMLRINSSCWSSFSSDQHETKAALKRSLKRERKIKKLKDYSREKVYLTASKDRYKQHICVHLWNTVVSLYKSSFCTKYWDLHYKNT